MKSSRVITLFRKMQIDMTFLAAAGTQTIVIRRALRLNPFYYYWLGVRLHNRDIPTSGGGSLFVETIPTLPSAQDPQEFSTTGTPPLQITISGTSTPAPPGLYVATASNLGPFLKVQIRGLQGATGGIRLYSEISAVLYCRAS
jgi:hypothetical protein